MGRRRRERRGAPGGALRGHDPRRRTAGARVGDAEDSHGGGEDGARERAGEEGAGEEDAGEEGVRVGREDGARERAGDDGTSEEGTRVGREDGASEDGAREADCPGRGRRRSPLHGPGDGGRERLAAGPCRSLRTARRRARRARRRPPRPAECVVAARSPAREDVGVADPGRRAVALVVNTTRPSASDLAHRARRWWEERGFDVLVHDGSEVSALADGPLDFAVSLGGDGTMLRTVQLVLDRQVPVLGVNLGNLGYLTQVEPADIELAFRRLVAGDFDVEERMTLSVTVGGAGGGRPTLVALNEVAMERSVPGHTIRVAVSIADRPFLTYVADGIIVATPTGSTAYNLSVRGPIVSPRLRAFVLTPISAHMLFDRSLVLEPDETVGLRLLDGRSAVLTVDGSTVVPLGIDATVEIAEGRRPALVVRFGRPDFHAVLRGKFGLTDR